MGSIDFILILIGVILLFIAAFGVSVRNINLMALGLALIAMTLLTGCDRPDPVEDNVVVNGEAPAPA